MKKLFSLPILIFSMFTFSCSTLGQSSGISNVAESPKIIDSGTYNPDKVPESELVTFSIDKNIAIVFINGNNVPWKANANIQVVKIPPGVQLFKVMNNKPGNNFPFLDVMATLEKGEKYIIKAVDGGGYIILDQNTNEKVSL